MKAEVGDYIYSDFFDSWLLIHKIIDDKNWYFTHEGKVMKAQTRLTYYMEKDLFRKNPFKLQ